jgi:hypothetical protein
MRTLLLVFGIAFLASLLPLLGILVVKFREFRGSRLVTCPETLGMATVELDAARAAWTEIAGGAKLKIHTCSRWPEHGNCGERCLERLKHIAGTENFARC